MRTRILLYVSLGLALLVGTGGVLAQGNIIGGLAQPRGFETNGQRPLMDYTPQETLGVAVVIEHMRTTDVHNLAAHMRLIDADVIFRSDPVQRLRRGGQAYCSGYNFTLRQPPGFFRLDELYVVGGPMDVLVVHKRTDLNAPAGSGGNLGGYPVEVSTLLRVNPATGLVTEWLDAPINRIGALVNAAGGQASVTSNNATRAECTGYPVSGAGLTRPPAPAAQGPIATGWPAVPAAEVDTTRGAAPVHTLSYGTTKAQQIWNAEEIQAGQAVRAWYAAWQAGNPLLLASFIAPDVVSRTSPASDLVRGNDALLRSVCGIIGGRLELKELYPIGADFTTMVLTEVTRVDANGQPMRVAGFFRVQRGLIVEWMDSVVEASGPAAAANPNSAACQTVNATLPAPAPAAAAATP